MTAIMHASYDAADLDADRVPGDPGPAGERRHWEEFETDDGRNLTARFAAKHQSRLQWPVVSFLAGAGLRAAHLPHPLWLVALVIAVTAIGGTAAQELLLRKTAGSSEPDWVAELSRYRHWLPHRQPPVPEPVLAAADWYLAAVPSSRWRSAQLIIARRPPEASWLTMGYTEYRGSRLVFHLGEHVACGPPGAAVATLAHELRHQRGWSRLPHMLTQAAWARGYLITGWAVPWPAAAWAAIALHAVLILASWINETGCDLAAASDTGPQAMEAAFDVMAASARQRSSQLPRLQRLTRQVLLWVEGPIHPPVPVRRAIARIWCRIRRGQPRDPWLSSVPAGITPPGEPGVFSTGPAPADGGSCD